ncbi:MAG TPA: hypothetical protein VIP46_00620 [Pyrinomonadaceae bacterium]
MKCAACGSTSLVEGELVDMSGGRMAYFKLADVPRWKATFGAGVREVRAYGCVNCGRLEFAVAFREDDVQRYRDFEGEQVSVMERLGAGAGVSGDDPIS